MNFKVLSLLKSRKREFTYLQDDLASGARWRTDVVRETTARVRRGTDATWQSCSGPCEAQVAHRARTCGRRPRVSTRDHTDARVGCHMAGGSACEGPTG